MRRCKVDTSRNGRLYVISRVYEILEVDTQSAGFCVLTFTLHHAYPRVQGSERRQRDAWHTHRRTYNVKNDHRSLSIFFA